ELGYTPTIQSVRERSDLPAVPTFINHFGSWNGAVEAAGLEPRPQGSKRTKPSHAYSDTDLLDILRDLGDELGRRPTIRTVRRRRDLPPVPTFISHFGSWNEAVETAGFEPTQRWPAQHDRPRFAPTSHGIEWAVDISADGGGVDLGETELDMRAEQIAITVDGRAFTLDTDTWLEL